MVYLKIAMRSKHFLKKTIDIMLVSETHFTSRSHLKIPKYNLYHTMHPDGTAHGGTAVIIKNNIKHHETDKYQSKLIQATSIVVRGLLWNDYHICHLLPT